jgi:hypothetical protein
LLSVKTSTLENRKRIGCRISSVEVPEKSFGVDELGRFRGFGTRRGTKNLSPFRPVPFLGSNPVTLPCLDEPSGPRASMERDGRRRGPVE